MKTPKSNLLTRAQNFHVSFITGIFLLLLNVDTIRADCGDPGSAAWTGAISSDWYDCRNWSPQTLPGYYDDGYTDIATFSASSPAAISVTASFSYLGGLAFNGSPYTITLAPPIADLGISGAGIVNNSGMTQSFVLPGGSTNVLIGFGNNASAGTSTMFTVDGSPNVGEDSRGHIAFSGNSTAGSGTFTLNGGTADGADGGWVFLTDSATAGSGVFVNNGGTVGFAYGGHTDFQNTSTAGNGTLTANGGQVLGAFGGIINFGARYTISNDPTAGAATLIANGGSAGIQGGSILFFGATTGGTSRIKVFGNGNLDISWHIDSNNLPLPITIGSIEGSGAVFLGGGSLSVGSNNLSTTFSGSIQDCGINCFSGGSLTKIGTGTLTLSGANTYTGVTTVSAGTLLVNSKPSSGTGTNKLKVNAGTLGGTGTIGGAVTVGSGRGSGAFLAPGTTGTGTLTLKKGLTFKSDGTYKFELKSSTVKADKVTVKGVTINNGALFSFIGLGSGTLSQGTVFTAINNTATAPISGTFSNLANGSIFTSNGNNFQVNYAGGTGNDLTLTVVP